MYIRNRTSNKQTAGRRRRHYFYALLLIPLLLAPAILEARNEAFDYKISKGLKLKILRNSEVPFIRAHLVINYMNTPENPAIPYLTILNIFGRGIKKPDTALLDTLRKLGNDYEVEYRPDFLWFKINFLPDKIPLFIRFLRNLYGYKPFLETDSRTTASYIKKRREDTRLRFTDSRSNYWKRFFKQKDWKRQIAYQLAYKHFFSGSQLGRTLITPQHVGAVKLRDLVNFYRQTYQLPNSLLVLKGDIANPLVVYGLLQRAFNSFKQQKPRIYPGEKFALHNSKKIIIFDTDNAGPPTLTWFEPIPTSKTRKPLLFNVILNNLLFGYPAGPMLSFNRQLRKIETQLVKHTRVSVISNTIRLRYRDIEKFINRAEREKKNIRNRIRKGEGRLDA
ncbi:MAG: insulinase family protein, partial [bacterium]|nr:insulinase family protein [bacterium]